MIAGNNAFDTSMMRRWLILGYLADDDYTMLTVERHDLIAARRQ